MIRHALVKDASVAMIRSALNQHGWVGGEPPSTEAEINASLDLQGGGAGEFPIPLEEIAGPGLAWGLAGWRMNSTRAALMVSVAGGALPTAQLGSESASDQLIWWDDTQATFDDGIQQLGYSRKA